mmetsp:Transcript_9658/g.17756  ORF Transcript_9658/g.17756 Transcript_9658/m.17756 type:complete len:101 (+) Transcript_9658:1-303(+)
MKDSFQRELQLFEASAETQLRENCHATVGATAEATPSIACRRADGPEIAMSTSAGKETVGQYLKDPLVGSILKLQTDGNELTRADADAYRGDATQMLTLI